MPYICRNFQRRLLMFYQRWFLHLSKLILMTAIASTSIAWSSLGRADIGDLEQKLGPRPIDGVYVEAVENYANPKQRQYGFDFGFWPLNPYYNGFSLDGFY